MTRLISKITLPVVIMIWSTYYVVDVSTRAPNSARLIKPVFIFMCVLFTINLFTDILVWKKNEHVLAGKRDKKEKPILRFEVCACVTALCLFVMSYLGFVITSSIGLFSGFWYLGRKGPILSLLISVGFSIGIWAIFKVLLKVPLPPGILGI